LFPSGKILLFVLRDLFFTFVPSASARPMARQVFRGYSFFLSGYRSVVAAMLAHLKAAHHQQRNIA
jgi:hypothetical protein